MNHNSPLWLASIAADLDKAPARPVCSIARVYRIYTEHQDVLSRAISIAQSRPFMAGFIRSETMFNLVVPDNPHADAVLYWSNCGSTRGGLSINEVRFPAWLLEAAPDDVWAWAKAVG